jgi:lipopolysaccharide transport system ATP-binding protein
MGAPRVVFQDVSKKFRRGERHDSLRDLIPAAARRLIGRAEARELAAEEFWALREVSFEVQAGEALGIIGRNGAGKSTILKLLTRILKPSRGSCRVIGRAGALIEVAAGFHPDLTGRENVYLQGAVMGMRRAEIGARFDEIVDFAGVEAFIDTPVKRYSSGMNARLGFAIAAHLNPDILLIDEVLSVGDLAFQEKCQSRMKTFLAQGVALVFVSHHLPAVAQLCQQVLLLESGRTACLGAPATAIAQYCAGSESAAGERGAVEVSAALHADGLNDAGASVFDVRPGDGLHLDVSLDFRADVDHVTVGIVVWDLTRELYVYGASSDVVGIPPFAARPGDARRLTFSFTANLTRGLYAIEVNVIDAAGHRFLAVVRGICHFQVVEQVSYDGIANLFLNGYDAETQHEQTDPHRRLDASHGAPHRRPAERAGARGVRIPRAVGR